MQIRINRQQTQDVVSPRDGTVFRFDPASSTARAVAVTVLQEQGDQVVVAGELSPTQRVILMPVHDGERVQEQSR